MQIIDAVTSACNQICVHLSDPLYDLVLKMVFEYASTCVRTNAVRAIHQLVECVANADPVKTLAKFFPFCAANIRIELENGASSLRTTSSSTPLPSDATLHWSKCFHLSWVAWKGTQFLLFRSRYLKGDRLQVCLIRCTCWVELTHWSCSDGKAVCSVSIRNLRCFNFVN